MKTEPNGKARITQTSEEQTVRRQHIATEKSRARECFKQRRPTTVFQPIFVAQTVHIDLVQEAIVCTTSDPHKDKIGVIKFYKIAKEFYYKK